MVLVKQSVSILVWPILNPKESRLTEEAQQLTRHNLEAKLVKRCWEDEAFRKEFAADPAGTFTKYLEVPAASLPKILVHEEEPGSWYIVLPAKPANAGQLSEAELEKVAGGVTPTVVATAVLVSGAVASGGAVVSGVISAAETGW
jgi:hypothetical protein